MARRLALLGLSGIFSIATIASACSASDEGDGFEEDDGNSSGNGGAGGGSGVGGFDPGNGGSTGSGNNCTHTDPNVDFDMDGFMPPDDCNDCDPNANPGAVEVVDTEPGDDGMIPPVSDEDCDGTADNPLPACDDGAAVDDADPNTAARAIDLCQEATGTSWGVMSARYVRANGTDMTANAGVGIFDAFGPNVAVQVGARMLGLSSGYSRLPGQAGACAHNSCTTVGAGTPPPAYPQNVPGCTPDSTINDDAAFEVQLRAPTNATGYQFYFKFYSFEFAEYVCTAYNDQFIALVTPPPAGAQDGNISFDSMGNPVSVNIAFFDVCDPVTNNDFAEWCIFDGGSCPPMPNPYCPSGPAELDGNGFRDAFGSGIEDGGATSWLQTTAPITGGEEFTVRFAIWDVGDAAYDSTALIDGFQWIATPGVSVGTGEIPDPK
jgi:hypothetical protein